MLSYKTGWGLVFPKQPVPGDWLGISLQEGGSKGLPLYHFFFFYIFYPSLIKLYLGLQVFLTFALPVLSVILLGKSERVAGECLVAG